MPYIKAVEKGEILGYAYAGKFKNRKAYDWSVEVTVYVKKDSRRAGVGSLLYKELEQSLKNIGVLNMNACIAVTKGEDEHLGNDSRYFHEKMGFHFVAELPECGCKFGKLYGVIWMEKPLKIGKITQNFPKSVHELVNIDRFFL